MVVLEPSQKLGVPVKVMAGSSYTVMEPSAVAVPQSDVLLIV